MFVIKAILEHVSHHFYMLFLQNQAKIISMFFNCLVNLFSYVFIAGSNGPVVVAVNMLIRRYIFLSPEIRITFVKN